MDISNAQRARVLVHALPYISARGVSVIIISSEIPEIQSICDRVAIMREGEIVKILEPEEFNDAETMLKYSIGG